MHIYTVHTRPFVRLSTCSLCLSGASYLWQKRSMIATIMT